MQVLCKLLLYNKYTTGAYDLLYSAVHPMKCLESDVMWCKHSYVDNLPEVHCAKLV